MRVILEDDRYKEGDFEGEGDINKETEILTIIVVFYKYSKPYINELLSTIKQFNNVKIASIYINDNENIDKLYEKITSTKSKYFFLLDCKLYFRNCKILFYRGCMLIIIMEF